MVDNDHYETGTDSTATEPNVSRRALLALSGVGGLSLLAGQSSAKQATQDSCCAFEDSNGDGLLEAPNHNGIDVSTVQTGQISSDTLSNARNSSLSTVNVAEYADLNDALSATTGDVIVRLPSGTTTFSDPLDEDRTVIIEGAGRKETTLHSDSTARFYQTFTDRPNVSIILRDLTLDMNHTASDGRVFQLAGNRDRVIFDSVGVKNVNLTEQTNNQGIIWSNATTPQLSAFYASADTVFRFDTFTNRQPYKYAVLYTDEIDSLTVEPTVKHIGTLYSGSTDYFYIGYKSHINDRAIIDGTFKDWDQYATFLTANTRGAIIDVRASAKNAGSGDIFRAGAAADNYGIIRFGGSVETADGHGDRGYIVQSPAPAAVILNNPTIFKTHVPVEIRGGHMISGSMTACDTGADDSTAPRPALQINDKTGRISQVNVEVSIVNQDPNRYLGPAVELNETGEHGMDDTTQIISGIARGYENTRVDDSTGSGTTVNTDRLFG